MNDDRSGMNYAVCKEPLWNAIESFRDEVRKLREERDEARREVCLLRASTTSESDIEEHARSRGWDCFEETTA